MKRKLISMLLFPYYLSGCASIDFNSKDGGLKYYEGIPYLLVQAADDCKINAQVILIPSVAKHLKMKNGIWGNSKLSIGLTQGMVTTAGQEADTKIPETLASLTGLYSATKSVSGKCHGSAAIYRVAENGKLELTDLPLPLPVPIPETPANGRPTQ